jgi:hypothetical protein
MAYIVKLAGMPRPMCGCEAVVYLGEKGYSPWSISEMLPQMSPGSVRTTLSKARKNGSKIPRFMGGVNGGVRE